MSYTSRLQSFTKSFMPVPAKGVTVGTGWPFSSMCRNPCSEPTTMICIEFGEQLYIRSFPRVLFGSCSQSLRRELRRWWADFEGFKPLGSRSLWIMRSLLTRMVSLCYTCWREEYWKTLQISLKNMPLQGRTIELIKMISNQHFMMLRSLAVLAGHLSSNIHGSCLWWRSCQIHLWLG